MASQVSDILNAIASLPVTVDSETITAYNIDDSLNSVAQTPARIVFPLAGDNAGATGQARTLGNNPKMSIQWTFEDLMLYQGVIEGSGLTFALPKLVQYAGNYIDVLKSNMDLSLHGVYVTDFAPEFGTYEFPASSGQFFFGCVFTLSIMETME